MIKIKQNLIYEVLVFLPYMVNNYIYIYLFNIFVKIFLEIKLIDQTNHTGLTVST